jgi:hypothetical protein
MSSLFLQNIRKKIVTEKKIQNKRVTVVYAVQLIACGKTLLSRRIQYVSRDLRATSDHYVFNTTEGHVFKNSAPQGRLSHQESIKETNLT